jgi:hypothetical protein
LPAQKRARSSDKRPDFAVSNKKIKLFPVSEDGGEAFSDPPNHFVLCGRGERTNRHAGNKTFRRLVDINKSLYHSSDRKKKSLLATSIVQAIYRQDPPGRFIRENKNSCLWVDVGMKQAIKKTGQALRENAPKKNSSPRQDFRSARAVTNEDNNSEEEDEFSSEEHGEYEGFKHVVVNLDLLTKDNSDNMTGVPPPPALTFGTSDWTLTSVGSVFHDMIPGVPPPSALTYGTSDWTFKNVSSVQEVPGVLVPPALNFQTSDCTLKSISSIFSAHFLTNHGGKAVFYA